MSSVIEEHSKTLNICKKLSASSEHQPFVLLGGLLGLADRFKNLKDAPTDADIEELRKYFPERNEPELRPQYIYIYIFFKIVRTLSCKHIGMTVVKAMTIN